MVEKAAGVSVGITAFANDLDASDSVSYTLDDSAGGRFSIDSLGVVKTAVALDAELATNHTIVVRATSTDGSFSLETFAISVLDVDEHDATAIGDSDSSPNQVVENSAVGTVVGVTAFADDLDVTDSVTYSLTDDAGGRFDIDSNTGVVTTKMVLDAEVGANHTVLVKATSTDTSFTTRSFTVTVVDQNDSVPVIQAGQSFSISENSPPGAVVGLSVAIDQDVTSTTFSNWMIVGGTGNGIFHINATTGMVTVASGAVLDHETTSMYTLDVTVSDGVNVSAVETINVDVSDVNELPSLSLTNQVFAIQEDASTTSPIKIADLVVEDDALGSEVFGLTGTDAAAFEILGTELYLKAGDDTGCRNEADV